MNRKTGIILAIAALLLGPPSSAQPAHLDELLARVAKWDFHQNRDDLLAVSELVVKAQGSPAELRQVEKRFIAFLQSEASFAGQDFVCRQLSVIGSEAAVPVLSRMLAVPKTADIARYALERIPGPAVDRALREMLAKTSDKTRIGIVNTLGFRRDAGAVAALRPLALGPDVPTAAAALFALAEIADPAAVRVLSQAHGTVAPALKASAAEAWLRAADRLPAETARPIYEKLYGAGEPAMVRVGALNGIARAGGPRAAQVLMEAASGRDARLQAAAIRALAPGSSQPLAARMPKLSEAGQVRVLGALAELRTAAALPVFTAALKGGSKTVRLAALEEIWQVGNSSTVPLLAEIAAGAGGEEQSAARLSLARMPGKEIDEAVARGIAGAATKVKAELIRAAGERGARAAAPVLLKLASDPDDEVRRESLRALRNTGSADQIPGLVGLVVKPVKAADRSEAVRSLAAVVRGSDASGVSRVLAAYRSVSEMEARGALMQVLAEGGSPQALPVLREGLKDEDAALKRAAILALSEWPDAVPIPDLLEVSRTASSPAHQVLALRGALKLIALPATGRSHRESVRLLAEAMSLAKQSEEKRSILGMLPRYPVQEALDLASASLNDKEVAAEARTAAERLQRALRR